MADEEDLYALLEVSPESDTATIRNAFRRLARRYHPDVANTGSVSHMQRLNAAYQVLSDPERRRVYDAQRLASRRPSSSAPATAHGTRPSPAQARVGSIERSAGPLQRMTTLEVADATPVAAVALASGGARVGVGLLDGRVQLWEAQPTQPARLVTTLAHGAGSSAGVLQELKLSAGGTLAAAWGFQLGLRVWQIQDGRTLWNTSAAAPTGTMDAVLYDDPPLIRLALPDAPIALADEDPFRWAYEGSRGSSVLSRPLRGPIDPAWALPLRSQEMGSSGLFPDPTDESWRVQLRDLSANGRLLLTLSSGATSKLSRARALAVWELDHRTLLGASQPRRVARVGGPAEELQFPVAVRPDLAVAAVSHFGERMHVITLRNGVRKPVETGPVPDEARAALAPNGDYLALARDTRLDLWRITDGRHVQSWRFGAEITALTFGVPGGRSVLGVGLQNGLIELWA
jgi:hypothetical protein